MKIGNQKLQSPPPKPPRRRYSDQLSVSSLGTYSGKSVNDENQMLKNDNLSKPGSKSKYLSLPSGWTSGFSADLNKLPVDSLQKNSVSNQLKHFNESKNIEIMKEKFPFQINCTNNYSSEKQSAFNHGQENRLMFDFNLSFCSTNYPRINSVNKDLLLDPIFYDSEPKKPIRNIIRRHFSDSAICYRNSSNEDLWKSNIDDNDSFFHYLRNIRKFSDDKSCCKKNYFLMREIELLKEINHKLWKHICDLQNSSEKKKQINESTEDSICLSGLLSSIYYAQKAKDSVMEERLKLLNDERDSTLLELEDTLSVMSKFMDMNSVLSTEKELSEHERNLCYVEPPTKLSELLTYQWKLLNQINKLKKEQAQEVNQMMAERDKALEKVTELEEELKNLHDFYTLLYTDNKKWEFTLLDVLRELVCQRDHVLSKIDNSLQLDNRSQVGDNSHTLYSLDKSYEMHKFTKHSYLLPLDDYKELISVDTCEETKKLKEDIMYLNKSLENEIKRREQAERKCLRFERIIHLLRKKMNGQNIGVLV